jgi:hypothetical protein
MKRFAILIAIAASFVGSYALGRWNGFRAASTLPGGPGGPLGIVKPAPISSTPVRPFPSSKLSSPLVSPPLTAVEGGYAAAQANLEDALGGLSALPLAERVGFVTGVFSFAARNLPPGESLQMADRIPPELRATALRTLVGEWIYARSSLEEEKRAQLRDQALTTTGRRQSIEVELSALLAASKPDPQLTAAWLDASSNRTVRSEMLATLVNAFPRDNPDAILKRMEGWTPWEKERVSRHFLSQWTYENPQEAWAWYQNAQSRFDTDLSSSIFMAWSDKDPEGAQKLLGTLPESPQRRTLLDTIGRNLAMKNTDAAVAWADGLADPKEREIAQRSVYEGAPRGVGAVLDFKDGFPVLRGVVPGSPLEGTAIKPGDRLLEVRQPDGATHSLYGNDLQTTVNLIRGEPGSQMQLRILRQNGDKFEEHLIPVTRGQLYLNEKTIPKG